MTSALYSALWRTNGASLCNRRKCTVVGHRIHVVVAVADESELVHRRAGSHHPPLSAFRNAGLTQQRRIVGWPVLLAHRCVYLV